MALNKEGGGLINFFLQKGGLLVGGGLIWEGGRGLGFTVIKTKLSCFCCLIKVIRGKSVLNFISGLQQDQEDFEYKILIQKSF